MNKKLSFLKWLDPFTYADILLEKTGKKDNRIVRYSTYIIVAFISALILYHIIFATLFGSKYPFVIVLSNSMEPHFYRGDILLIKNADKINAPLIELEYKTLKDTPIQYYLKSYCLINNEELVQCSEAKLRYSLGLISLKDFVTKELHFKNGKILEIKHDNFDSVVYFSKLQKKQIIHTAIALLKAEDGVYVLTKGSSPNNPLIDQEANIVNAAIPVEEIEGKSFFKIPLLGYIKLILVDDVLQLLGGCLETQTCVFP